MAYTLYNSDGTILAIIADGTVDQHTTSLTLVGKNVTSYGQYLNENFITLLSNGASSQENRTLNPLTGQFWYDAINSKLEIYDDSLNGWRNIVGAEIAETLPSTLGKGDFWFDSVNKQLKIKFNESTSTWVVGPAFSVLIGENGWVLPTIPMTDELGYTKDVTLLKNYGKTIGVVSSEKFNITTATSAAYFGTSTIDTVVSGLTVVGDISYTGNLLNKYLSMSIELPDIVPMVRSQKSIPNSGKGYNGTFYTSAVQTQLSTSTSETVTIDKTSVMPEGLSVLNNQIIFANTGTYDIKVSVEYQNLDSLPHTANAWIVKGNTGTILISTASNFISTVPGTTTTSTFTATLSTFAARIHNVASTSTWLGIAYSPDNNIFVAISKSVIYKNVPYNEHTGNGQNATFNVTVTKDYSVLVSNPGTGYAVGNQLTIDGGILGGANGTNNVVFTVTAVAPGTGAIISISPVTGVPVGQISAVSADGTSWVYNPIPNSIPLANWSDITYSNGNFMAVGAADPGYSITMYSGDGVNWTRGDNSIQGNFVSLASNGIGTWVAVSPSTKAAYSVGDQKTLWTTTDNLPWSDGGIAVTYGNGVFATIAGGIINSNKAAYSTDGISWTETSVPLAKQWVSMAHGNETFVVISATGDVVYSPNGKDWLTNVSGLPGINWTNVRYGNNTFLAVSNQYAALSTDGIAWEIYNLPVVQNWISLACGANSWIALPRETDTNGLTVVSSIKNSITTNGKVLSSWSFTDYFDKGDFFELHWSANSTSVIIKSDTPQTYPVVLDTVSAEVTIEQIKDMELFNSLIVTNAYDYENVVTYQNPAIAELLTMSFPPANHNKVPFDLLIEETGLPVGTEARVICHTPANFSNLINIEGVPTPLGDHQVRRFRIIYDRAANQNRWDALNVYAIPGKTSLTNILPKSDPIVNVDIVSQAASNGVVVVYTSDYVIDGAPVYQINWTNVPN